jgi:hypothetical protein
MSEENGDRQLEFLIPADLLQKTLNIIAQLPYIQVAEVANRLRELPEFKREEVLRGE